MEFDIAVNEVEQQALKIQSNDLIEQNFQIFNEFKDRVVRDEEGIPNNFARMWELCMESLSATAQFYDYSKEFAESYKYFCDEEVNNRMRKETSSESKQRVYDNLYNDINNKYKKDIEENEKLLAERISMIYGKITLYNNVILEHGTKEEIQLYNNKLKMLEFNIESLDKNNLDSDLLHDLVYKISSLMNLFEENI